MLLVLLLLQRHKWNISGAGTVKHQHFLHIPGRARLRLGTAAVSAEYSGGRLEGGFAGKELLLLLLMGMLGLAVLLLRAVVERVENWRKRHGRLTIEKGGTILDVGFRHFCADQFGKKRRQYVCVPKNLVPKIQKFNVIPKMRFIQTN